MAIFETKVLKAEADAVAPMAPTCDSCSSSTVVAWGRVARIALQYLQWLKPHQKRVRGSNRRGRIVTSVVCLSVASSYQLGLSRSERKLLKSLQIIPELNSRSVQHGPAGSHASGCQPPTTTQSCTALQDPFPCMVPARTVPNWPPLKVPRSVPSSA